MGSPMTYPNLNEVTDDVITQMRKLSTLFCQVWEPPYERARIGSTKPHRRISSK